MNEQNKKRQRRVRRITTDPAFIQSAYGPPGIAAPVLPANPKRPDNVRLELWLHTTTKDAKSLAKLANEPLAKQIVHGYLEATLPELAALTEERTVAAIGAWIVISIGPPKAEEARTSNKQFHQTSLTLLKGNRPKEAERWRRRELRFRIHIRNETPATYREKERWRGFRPGSCRAKR